jgi:hypothetical protein
MSYEAKHRGRVQLAFEMIQRALAEVLILPSGFITAIFLARRLGPMIYGLSTLVSRLVLWIEWICTSVFSSTTIEFIGEASDWKPIGATVVG